MKKTKIIFASIFLSHVLLAGFDDLIGMAGLGYFVSVQKVVLPKEDMNLINKISVSPQGAWIITSDHQGLFKEWTLKGGFAEFSAEITPKKTIFGIMPFFSPRGTYAVLNSSVNNTQFSGTAYLEIRVSKDIEVAFSGYTSLVNPSKPGITDMQWPSVFDFSSDEKLFAYSASGYDLIVFDFISKESTVIKDLKYPNYISDITFHPQNNKIIAVKSGDNGVIQLFNTDTKEAFKSFAGNGQNLGDGPWFDEKTVRFSTDGAYLATTSNLSTAFRVWNVTSGEPLFQSNDIENNQIRVTKDYMAIGNYLFDQKAHSIKRMNVAHKMISVAFSPSGQLFALAHTGVVLLYKTSDLSLVDAYGFADKSYLSEIIFADDEHFYFKLEPKNILYATINPEGRGTISPQWPMPNFSKSDVVSSSHKSENKRN